jgi:glycosyltransferase involved in cell wall biosynthesis
MIKVTHIVSGLSADGAERMLDNVASSLDPDRFRSEVITLTDFGDLGLGMRERGIPVRALEMGRGRPNPLALFRLAAWLRASEPQIVQTWMYHADLAGGLAARLAGKPKVIWGIHHSSLKSGENRRGTIWTARACARLSKLLPARIVCCSPAARRVHTGIGYAQHKTEVIPNGVDIDAFRPDHDAREAVRRKLDIPTGALVLGMAARFHIQKDHRNFVQAAARVARKIPSAYFVLCGAEMNWDNTILRRWIIDAGIQSRMRLLGIRRDMNRVFTGLDIATSSSLSEALPMSIAEAMASAVPCAVTDVGDCALLVGDTGLVVPPLDSGALACAWEQLLMMDHDARRNLGAAARRRVESHFSLNIALQRYQELYVRVAGDRSAA